VVVPDLPGCFSVGDTLEEALGNSQEAILLHLERLLDDKQAIPKPSAPASLQRKRAFRGWTWAVDDVDLIELISGSGSYQCHAKAGDRAGLIATRW
jgi:predicted RNase H-like HicB family nuclease